MPRAAVLPGQLLADGPGGHAPLTGGFGDQAGKCVGAAGWGRCGHFPHLSSLALRPSPTLPPSAPTGAPGWEPALFCPVPGSLTPSLPALWWPWLLGTRLSAPQRARAGAGWEQDGRSQALLPPHAVPQTERPGSLGYLGPLVIFTATSSRDKYTSPSPPAAPTMSPSSPRFLRPGSLRSSPHTPSW